MCGLCHNPICDGISHAQNDRFLADAGTDSHGSKSLASIVQQLNRGDASWKSISTITYTFANTLPNYAKNMEEYEGFNSFGSQQKDMARLALSVWSDVADISFRESTSAFSPISFANSYTLADYSAAHAYLPGFSAWAGDVWVNSSLEYNQSPEVGGYGFKVLVHEIGHAIGQPHPGDYNAGTGRLSYQKDAAYAEDTAQYSIMSYWGEENTGADFGKSYAQTPMLHDVLAIQAKYGVNENTRVDDTIYGFNSNTGSVIFDFENNKNPVFCIWDAGGTDTIDFSGFADGVILDLNPGGFSSAAGLVDNISIAYGTIIENAFGGAGNDVILGNKWDNVVDGGLGEDRFVIDVDKENAATYILDSGQIVIYGDHGIDQIQNVEMISYADASLVVADQQSYSILEYAASYEDIELAFGTDEQKLYQHFVEFGLSEGRTIDFSALDYIASHADLIEAYGADVQAGARHYIEFGRFENRAITFDRAAFMDANLDLVQIHGVDANAAKLFIEF